MHILRSINVLTSYISKPTEESKKSNEDIVTKYKYIPEYPCSNVLRVMDNFSKQSEQISKDMNIHKVPYCEVDC